jgi:hypothetical protein
MKVFETMGLCRSGHHAVLNWIFSNVAGFQIGWDYKLTKFIGIDLHFLDEANHDIPLSFKFVDEFLPQIKNLIVGYEDTPWDYTIFREDKKYNGALSLNYKQEYNIESQGRLVVIRDFYNNLSSRIKANEKKLQKEWQSEKVFYFKTEEEYIERWKNLAKACVEEKVSYIRFEDWTSNKKIRNEILSKHFGMSELRGTSEIKGT